MLVRFKVNLGSIDASVVGLDFRACTEGSELEVSDKAGAWLVGKGIACEVHRPKPLKAVPPPPEILATPEPEPIVAPVVEVIPEPKQEQPVVSAPRPVLPVKRSKEK